MAETVHVGGKKKSAGEIPALIVVHLRVLEKGLYNHV